MTSSSIINLPVSPVSPVSQEFVNPNLGQPSQVVELSPTVSDSSSRDTAVTLSGKSPTEVEKIKEKNTNTPQNAKPSMISILFMIIFGGCLGWISGKQGINPACMYISTRS
ncbi:MAG: hypothetical protein ACKO3R_10100 [bacterium]